MGKVLVEASALTCGATSPHVGVVTLTGASRLLVDGSRVLTAATIPGPAGTTPFPGCTNPAELSGPCTKVEKLEKGQSTRLKVDGEFVLLDSLEATTDRSSTVAVVAVNHDRLSAE